MQAIKLKRPLQVGGVLELQAELIEAFCERHHIQRMALFGSVLRDDFTRNSDVDVLVEFDAAHIPGLFAFMEMQFEMEALLGHPVDLLTFRSLHHFIRDQVLREAVTIYESA